MNKWYIKILNLLLQIVCVTVLVVGGSVLMDGMYLFNIPKISDVEKVTIAYPLLSDSVKETTDPEQIELAVKLTGFLKYKLFVKPDISKDALITITYYTDNKEPISVSANENTVWWRGKAHAIKDEGSFVKLTEGVFLFAEIAK